ncbi:MAG: vanadium-dependent haloperoxidase [Longimicrobiaceae bacterium]
MPKAHTLTDNFSDNARDTAKWYEYGPVQEVNQRLEIRPGSSLDDSYGGYASVNRYDLTGSEVVVEFVRVLRGADGAETYMTLENSADDTIVVKVQQGMFYGSYRAAGASSSTHVRDLAYDPTAHRWVRIREQLGVLYYEYSADGCAWNLLGSAPVPFDVTSVKVDLTAGTYLPVSSPGTAVFDNFNAPERGDARRVEERRLSAREVREEAAELAASRRHDEHANNNDEVAYPNRPLVGNFSKSLKHDSLGDPDPASYASLLRALESRDPADFEEIILASSTALKLTNPQSGLTFDVEGPDAQEVTQPPAPRFESEQAAHEAGELYWMAVARDVYFGSYGSDTAVAAAINSLGSEFPRFGGTVPVTAQNVFRGIYPGEQVGPYVSQFLLKGNTDPRKPDGLGRDANEGFISYGSRVIDQRQIPAAAGVDYLTTFTAWLGAQNGVDTRGQDQFDTTRRFIRNLRDGTTFVHFDQVLDAWYNAAWILMSEPTGNQLAFVSGSTGRPQIDLEFPKDQGNPYDPPGTAMDSKTQVGFATFGPTHLLQVLGETLGRALRAVWFQKWFVHRRLRPEEYGGRVHNHVTGARTYPLHASIVTSLQSGGLAPYFGNAGEKFPSSYLLPQAYPEGAPTHPAYGAGHATGSGALATMLKAFFDESTPIENPVLASSDGLSLVAYTGSDAGQMTVGGELNKLAGNIAIFRNAAGVHWRSDYTESLLLGEAVAIRMLQEMSLGFNEDDAFFELTKFDGQKIRIFDGKVVPVIA